MSECGNAHAEEHVSVHESIVCGGEPGELKHLSSRRKRKQHVILEVAASETERAQTDVRACRGSDCIRDLPRVAERSWKDRPERVRAP